MTSESDLYSSSPYLVHITSDDRGGPLLPPVYEDDASDMSRQVRDSVRGRRPEALDRFVCILADRRLYPGAGRFGAYVEDPRVAGSQRAVCLSQIPLGLLDRLIRRRSHWGLVFTKQTVLRQRGAPVWYLRIGSSQEKALATLIEREAARNPFDSGAPLWELTPLIDRPAERRTAEFEWEREWRIAGEDGFPFEPEDVELLFAPEDMHPHVEKFLRESAREDEMPEYDCPLVDPTWEAELVHRLIREHARSKSAR